MFGTMGGDAQPQILLQIAARLFRHGQSPATAINAGRWAFRGPTTGFDTWIDPGSIGSTSKGTHPPHGRPISPTSAIAPRRDAWDSGFGHAHAIVGLEGDRRWRSTNLIGSAAGG